VDAFSARRLIVLYAMILAFDAVSIALPGGPGYAPDSGFTFSAIIYALIVWRLWHGSQIAWWIGFVFAAVLDLPLAFLIGVPTDLGSVLMTLCACAELMVLVTLQFAWSRGRRSAASS
jgi:hypothetical protein